MLKKKIVKGMLSLATAIMLVGSDPVIPMMESVGVVQEVEELQGSSAVLKGIGYDREKTQSL